MDMTQTSINLWQTNLVLNINFQKWFSGIVCEKHVNRKEPNISLGGMLCKAVLIPKKVERCVFYDTGHILLSTAQLQGSFVMFGWQILSILIDPKICFGFAYIFSNLLNFP